MTDQEQFEDDLFKLLMKNLARSEGERLIQENERLKLDPAAAVPKDIDRRCLRLIERETAKQNRRVTIVGTAKLLGRFLVAALIAVLLFSTAFALSPSFRSQTLNLLMQVDAEAATWLAADSTDEDLADFAPEISVDWVPEGFTRIDTEKDRQSSTVVYSNEVGETIEIICFSPNSSDVLSTFDLEDADYSEEITINGAAGLLVQKNNSIRIAWADESTGIIIRVYSDCENAETLLQIAESVNIAW